MAKMMKLPEILGPKNIERLKNNKEELGDLREEIDYLEK